MLEFDASGGAPTKEPEELAMTEQKTGVGYKLRMLWLYMEVA